MSGDWRETPAGLSLVEVLALSPGPRAHAEPGFPIPGTFSVNGRQVALTAALGPMAESSPRTMPNHVDVVELVRQARAAERDLAAEEQRAAEARAALAPLVIEVTDRERAALAAALGEGGN